MRAEHYMTYHEAAAVYLNRLRTLQTATRPPLGVAPRRSAAGIPAELLVGQADEIAAVSASMVELAQPYVESQDPSTRQGIGGQVLAQAAAELQLATELLQMAPEEADGPRPATRASRSLQLQQAISVVESAMALPVEQGLPSATGRVRRTGRPATLEMACAALEKSATVTTSAITRRTVELGSSIVLDLLLKTEWSVVSTGASLLRKDIAEKLEAVSAGAGTLFKRAVDTAAKTLLNVYDKLLLLLGKDVESRARQKVQEWLNQIKQEAGEEGQEALFSAMLQRFYGVNGFRQALKGWLSQTRADVEGVNDTTAQVDALAGQFATVAGRLGTLQTAITLARMVKMPQVLTVITVIEVALLAVVVYAGFDYIGYREPRFPNMAKGVAEVIQEGLLG